MSKKVNFEENLKELETLVKKLESGEMSLEDSLNNFEKAVGYYKNCKKSLSEAEQKIKILTDNLKEEDF